MDNNFEERESWTSRLGFVLAAAGSAVGLGNIWRFPFVAGENGGAVFLLIYLVAIILIGYPVMVTEMSLGRKTNKNPVGAFKSLAPDAPWWLVGAIGVLAGFIILSFYGVVGGWSLNYTLEAVSGFGEIEDFAALFGGTISDTGGVILWQAIFMVLTVGIIASGVVKGIQRAVKTLMPILFVLLLALIVRSLTLEGASQGLSFYLRPDFGAVDLGTLQAALGQAFFTLSLGMGAMLTYGSYLSDKDNICDSAAQVVGLDTLVAVLSGFAIFPAVFALGYDPAAGPGLTFVTLPAVFAQIPFGGMFGFIFFLLLSIAALTSAISLLEVVVAWLIDEKHWPRKKAATAMGAVIFVVGLPTALGFSVWSDVQLMGMGILDFYDFIASDILLPVGGLLTVIFAAYVWKAQNVVEEANKAEGTLSVGKIYTGLIKYVVPVVIAVILVLGIVG